MLLKAESKPEKFGNKLDEESIEFHWDDFERKFPLLVPKDVIMRVAGGTAVTLCFHRPDRISPDKLVGLVLSVSQEFKLSEPTIGSGMVRTVVAETIIDEQLAESGNISVVIPETQMLIGDGVFRESPLFSYGALTVYLTRPAGLKTADPYERTLLHWPVHCAGIFSPPPHERFGKKVEIKFQHRRVFGGAVNVFVGMKTGCIYQHDNVPLDIHCTNSSDEMIDFKVVKISLSESHVFGRQRHVFKRFENVLLSHQPDESPSCLVFVPFCDITSVPESVNTDCRRVEVNHNLNISLSLGSFQRKVHIDVPILLLPLKSESITIA